MAGLASLVGLGDEADVATEAGKEYGEKNKMATGDTAADAVRHMTMAALAVKEHPNWGDTIMQAHETFGGGDQRAKRMDEYNNEMGIKAFLEIPEDYRKDMSNEEIAAYMTEIVDKEYQYRLKNDGQPSGEGPKFYEKPLVTDGGYDKGGLVEDPMMPSEEGLDQGEPITLEDFLNFGLDMAPVTGEIRSAQEGIEAYEEGDYVGAALGAAGAIPGVGMVGRGVKKGAGAVADVAEEVAPMFREFFTPLKKTRSGYKPEKPPVLRVDESLDAELNPRLDRAMSADTAGSVMPAPGKFWNPESRGYKGDGMTKGLRDAGVELDMEYGNYVMMGKGKPQDVTNQTFENLYVTARTSEKKSTGNKNNKSVARANLYDGPSLTVDDMKANYKANTGKTGAEVRTNLLQPERFSVKVGDEYRQLDNPIVAVQPMVGKKDHYYTLDTQFVGPARMDQLTKKNRRMQADGSYKEELPQPNLRPVTVGDVKLGNQVGTIKVGKNEHPLFDYIEVDATASAPADMGNIPKFNEGGLMSEDETGMPIVGYDEESGNPIPPGSDAENVRDDIPAMLSEGEFVVPADVVKWHGLKHMMEMREEAKEGLMAMHMEDQIKSPEHEVEEEDMVETSEHEMDEHGNEDYPTEMGQMSDIEYGDESLLVLMAADGGEVTSGEETTAPKQRLVRRLVRDPKTGKMIVMFVDIATGKPVARKSVQEGLADGTMETIDQTPQRMFEQMGGEMSDKSTAEEVVEGETGVAMPSASSGGSGEGVGNSEPVQRTLENNYGFIDPSKRAIAAGVAGALPIPGAGVLASWGINANNTDAVNAARADLGLDPVDTTLGVNLDAATGLVTDQADKSDDISVGPWAADVTMTDQYGRLQRDVADLDKSSLGTRAKNSKVARFFSGKTPTTETWLQGDGAVSTAGLPYRTSSTLTPFEIQEKRAAGLAQDPTTGRWGYSTAAEQIGRETFGDMSEDAFGSDLGISTADEYGLSLATDRGRQEALGISKQDQELFDDNDDGKLDAKEVANMKEFYGEPTSDGGGGSMGLGYDSSYGSQAEADAVASDGWGSDAQFDAIDAQFDSLGSTSGGSGGNYDGGGSDTSDSTSDSMSFGSGSWDSVFNKGGYAIKKKQKYASIKK